MTSRFRGPNEAKTAWLASWRGGAGLCCESDPAWVVVRFRVNQYRWVLALD